jgi:CO/xanthine dehydrogenase Mo-binding subunit/aerobic-type carbon monoxide dehydrogenase small subunit (CoxS/CutS family)
MTIQTPPLTLTVNGEPLRLVTDPGRRLSDVLRDDCGLKGTKVGCDAGDCGACTVLVDGEQVCACLKPVGQVSGMSITTVESLSSEGLSNLQRSFLRHGAAQCGICTPGMLMAAQSLLEHTPVPDRREVEDALGGVLCRCTGYRKIVDAVCDAANIQDAPQLPDAGGSVGKRIERLDGRPKVAGTEVFGADFAPEEALLVRAIRSPHDRASFTFGDLERWRAKRDAVELVLTARDLGGDNRFGVIPSFADQPALAEAAVRFRGEAIALVAGRADLLRDLDLGDFPVEWQVEGGAATIDEAIATTAPPLHESRPDNRLITGRVVTGDAEAALAECAHVASKTFQTSYVEHAYIEPEAGCAWLDGDTLVIQACTQAPHMDREETARVLGLDPDAVRIVPAAAGGGFGSKLDVSLQPLVGLVTLKTGKPCRMVYGRRESMMSTTKRHPAHMTATIGAQADGRIAGMTVSGDFNTGAYASWGPTVAVRVPVHGSGPYYTPNYRAEATAIHTNGPVSGAFRGFGVPQVAMIQETLYDELAEACGLDRLEFRQINALTDGQRSVCGQEMRAAGIRECLDALTTRWKDALAEAAAFNRRSDAIRRGVGVASCWYGCGNTALPNPSTVRVGITAEGQLRLHQGATDIGQGSNTVVAQICADALGLPVGLFDLIGPDTALTPDCGKTSASRQTVVTGKAAELAGGALRAEILRLSNMGPEARLVLCGGRVTISAAGETAEIDLGILKPGQDGYVLSAEETYDPPTSSLDENGQGTPYAVYGYGAQIAVVDVDTRLGTVKVRHVVAAHDVGRAINPLLAEGQIEGGIAQGLGMALMEEYVPGRTENLHDYLIPTVGDMPEIESILIEKPDPEGPMGAKGLGEHVLIPTTPAILNAIRHASGAVLTRTPALPHRVLAAIREANS